MAAQDKLPSCEDLLDKARKVYTMYGTLGAFERAMKGKYKSSETKIPEGGTWKPPTKDKSSEGLGKGKTKAPSKNAKKKDSPVQVPKPTKPFKGDQTLAQATRFIFDGTLSREAVYAVADGDIGRVWNCLKVRVLLSEEAKRTHVE